MLESDVKPQNGAKIGLRLTLMCDYEASVCVNKTKNMINVQQEEEQHQLVQMT